MTESSCYFCGYTKSFVTHHIIPKAWGGTNTEDNLLLICPSCHSLIHDKKWCIVWKEHFGWWYLVSPDYMDYLVPSNKTRRQYPQVSLDTAVRLGKLEPTLVPLPGRDSSELREGWKVP